MVNQQENKYQEALGVIEKALIQKLNASAILIERPELNTLHELVDKATPKATKKPWSTCPNCGVHMEGGHDLPIDCINYCFNCGQALEREVL